MSQTNATFSLEAILFELEQIISSDAFAKAERLKDLLIYVVNATLDGKASSIKGYTLGVEVFGRPVSFDPQTDTVVRVTAVRLRKKLQDYYAALDSPGPIQILLPPRSYVPTFTANPNYQKPINLSPTNQQPFIHRRKFAVATGTSLIILVALGVWQYNSHWPTQDIDLDLATLEGKVAKQAAKLGVQYQQKDDHANAVIHFQKAVNAAPSNITLQLQLGTSYLVVDEVEKAKLAFDTAMQTAKQNHKPIQVMAQIHYHQAEYLRTIKQYQKSAERYQQVLTLLTNNTQNQPLKIKAFNRLAHVHNRLAHLDQAQYNISQAFTLYEQLSAQPQPLIVELLITRGLMHQYKDMPVEAIGDFLNAVKKAQAHFGTSHSNVARPLGYLAMMYAYTKQYEQGIEHYNQALEIVLAHFDKRHTKVAKLYNNMAAIYTNKKQYDQAQALYQQALDINQNRQEKPRLSYALNLYNLGMLQQLKDNHQKALDYLNQSLTIYQLAFGDEHPEVATIWEDIGNSHQALGDTTQAKQYYQKALPVYQKQLGAEHSRTRELIAKVANPTFPAQPP